MFPMGAYKSARAKAVSVLFCTVDILIRFESVRELDERIYVSDIEHYYFNKPKEIIYHSI